MSFLLDALFNGHGEEFGHDEVVVVVPDYCGVVDFLEEAALEVNQVLSVHLHDASEAVDQSLDLLVVVELVGDDSGHAQYPRTLLQSHLSSCGQAVSREDAEGKCDEEGLRCIVDHFHCFQTHFQSWDLDGADGADDGFREELITEHFLAGGEVLLVDEDGDLLVIATSGTCIAVFMSAFGLGDCLCIEADARSESHLLEGKHLLVFFLTGQSFRRIAILVHAFVHLGPKLASGQELPQESQHLPEQLALSLFVQVHLLAVGLESHHCLFVQLRRYILSGATGLNQADRLCCLTLVARQHRSILLWKKKPLRLTHAREKVKKGGQRQGGIGTDGVRGNWGMRGGVRVVENIQIR